MGFSLVVYNVLEQRGLSINRGDPFETWLVILGITVAFTSAFYLSLTYYFYRVCMLYADQADPKNQSIAGSTNIQPHGNSASQVTNA